MTDVKGLSGWLPREDVELKYFGLNRDGGINRSFIKLTIREKIKEFLLRLVNKL